MATTKIWKVDSHLRRVVDYAKNENKTINPDWEKSSYQAMEDVMNYAADDLKTEQKFYVSGINCVPERANGGSSERTLEGMKSHEADTLSAV